MSVWPLRSRAIAIVSRGSLSTATLPLYACDCQRMSQGLAIPSMSSLTRSVRQAMPVE